MIAGPSLFDMLIFLGCLLAMLLSLMPAKLAISVCLGVSLWGIGINTAAMYEMITVKMVYSLAGMVEIFSALGLILYSKWLIQRADQVFFLIMASFLLLSSALNVIFIPVYLYTEFLNYGMYQAAFHSIAVLHVLVMLGYSNGIKSGITNLRSLWLRYNAHYSNS